MTFHNEMYCTIKFLSLLVATSKNITFYIFERLRLPFFHSLRVTNIAVDSDYGLFIGYQMPTDKHERLKACLHLLCKDLNNLVELGALLPST